MCLFSLNKTHDMVQNHSDFKNHRCKEVKTPIVKKPPMSLLGLSSTLDPAKED